MSHLPAGAYPRHASEQACARVRRREAGQSRATILFSSLVLLILLFAFTTFLARAYRGKEASLAERWSTRGDANLKGGNMDAALEDYRSALLYDPDNFPDQLHLAQALAAKGQIDQASGYLITLLSKQPNNGEVNLELARLAAHERQVNAAVGYYHAAIYGVWMNDTLEAHVQARIELANYLLQQGQKQQALAEIIELASGTSPDDTSQLITVGNLFLEAGAPDRALHEFQLALKNNAKNAEALLGAGQSEYQLENYPAAVTYLFRAGKIKPDEKGIQNLLGNARSIVEADPYLSGLSTHERADTAARDFNAALDNLADCATQKDILLSGSSANSSLAALYAAADKNRNAWAASKIAQDPDLIDTVMQMTLKLETAAQQTCGSPGTGPNLGILLLSSQIQTAGQ